MTPRGALDAPARRPSKCLGAFCGWLAAVWVSAAAAAPAPLAWEAHDGYRMARLQVPATGRTGFTLMSPEQTGLFFTNQLSYERSLTNQNLLNGAGVCAGDYDGDGLPDLYFCNLEGANGLFRNQGGFKFENVTLGAGVACAHQTSRGAAFADVDGDGRLDLLVTSLLGPNAYLRNDGQGHFQDLTEEAGLVLKNAGCASLALGDFDGDGSLDLCLANNGDNSVLRSGGRIAFRMVNGRPVLSGRAAQRYRIVEGVLIELGPLPALYRNDGHGHFTAVSWTDGTFLTEEGQPLKEPPRDLSLMVAFRDLNGDGLPDLYVCNDFQTPDRIWINQGQGRFQALPDLALRSTCLFSMCVDFADIDRDGWDDFVNGDMWSRSHALRLRQTGATNPSPAHVGERMDRQQTHRNTLQLNRGDGTYAEIAHFAGLDASDWTWSVAFLDVDLDGYEDLLVANGHAYDTQDLDAIARQPLAPGTATANMRGGKELRDFPPLHTPNFLFRNRGDRTFEEVGAAWGFNSTNICHGICLADLDNDGDLDVVVSCLWKPPLVYRNDSTAPRVAVRLKGQAPNTQGIGAKMILRGGAVPLQSQEMQCGGRYLSSDQPQRTFAAGTLTNRMTLEVKWRSGKRSFLANVEPNCLYEVAEPSAGSPIIPMPPIHPIPPLFEDLSAPLAHTQVDRPFNDLERQPLLPKLLSRLGPGVSWFDLDGDGWEDLIIGSGAGGLMGVYRNDGKGGFARVEGGPFEQPVSRDQTTVLGYRTAEGGAVLLAGSATYEDGQTNGSVARSYEWPGVPPSSGAAMLTPEMPGAASLLRPGTAALRAGTVQDRLPGSSSSTGPLALADVDGDGQLELFVGGRVVPGRYPEAATSQMFRGRGGQWVLDAENSKALVGVGLVSGAVFSDLDGDGWPDLVLACEWGPVRLFHNEHGKLVAWDWKVRVEGGSALMPLSALTGWWSGVAAGDLDGDGRLDLVVGNWGLNSSYHRPSVAQPARMYYGDFDDNGVLDILEAETDWETGRIVPRRDLGWLAGGWPLLRTRFPSYRSFSVADLQEVLGDSAAKAREARAVTLATTLLLNRGDHFEAVALPGEAQHAPAFGVCVGDLDGDGHEDVFLSQNFFGMRLEEPRLDAGRGLWLRGDGTGKLTPVAGQESGLKIYGEQRGAALCDYDHDGRVDLVVGQNNGATKLYHNIGGKPGLRVKLVGRAGNPTGIGAVLRLLYPAAPSGPPLQPSTFNLQPSRRGPAREIHAGSGYWSQDGAVQVLGMPRAPSQIWVRWSGGKETTSDIPAGAREVTVRE